MGYKRAFSQRKFSFPAAPSLRNLATGLVGQVASRVLARHFSAPASSSGASSSRSYSRGRSTLRAGYMRKTRYRKKRKSRYRRKRRYGTSYRWRRTHGWAPKWGRRYWPRKAKGGTWRRFQLVRNLAVTELRPCNFDAAGAFDQRYHYQYGNFAMVPAVDRFRIVFQRAQNYNLPADQPTDAADRGLRLQINPDGPVTRWRLKVEHTFVVFLPDSAINPGDGEAPARPRLTEPFSLWIYVLVPRKSKVPGTNFGAVADEFLACGNYGRRMRLGRDFDWPESNPVANTGAANDGARLRRAPLINRELWKVKKKRFINFPQDYKSQHTFKFAWDFTNAMTDRDIMPFGSAAWKWKNSCIPRVLIIHSGFEVGPRIYQTQKAWYAASGNPGVLQLANPATLWANQSEPVFATQQFQTVYNQPSGAGNSRWGQMQGLEPNYT